MAYGFAEKLAQADKRAKQIGAMCDEWVKHKVVRHEKDGATGVRVIRVWLPGQPDGLEPAISEFAHAARASLDNIAYALGETAGAAFDEKARKTSQFPIATKQPPTPADFNACIGCVPKGARTIIENLQPTADPEANEWLANLRELNNDDKHHLGFTATGHQSGFGIGASRFFDSMTIGVLAMQSQPVDDDGAIEVGRYSGCELTIAGKTYDRVAIEIDADVDFVGGVLNGKHVATVVNAIASNLRDKVIAPLSKFL
ncbi:MAG TPA: hypothetical protein VHC63_15325 [Acidimicrobiales bacterium]|nr:hypothetical protein [Acidimicrobiales bacterium]